MKDELKKVNLDNIHKHYDNIRKEDFVMEVFESGRLGPEFDHKLTQLKANSLTDQELKMINPELYEFSLQFAKLKQTVYNDLQKENKNPDAEALELVNELAQTLTAINEEVDQLNEETWNKDKDPITIDQQEQNLILVDEYISLKLRYRQQR
jgi:hypothetical protein